MRMETICLSKMLAINKTTTQIVTAMNISDLVWCMEIAKYSGAISKFPLKWTSQNTSSKAVCGI